MTPESWIILGTAAIGIAAAIGLACIAIEAVVRRRADRECLYQQADCTAANPCPWCQRDISIGEYGR